MVADDRNRLGIVLLVDTNFIGDGSAAYEALRRLDAEGWIELARTDVVDTELADASDPATRTRLLAESAEYPETLGPVVLGHSRWGHAVWAGDTDDERIGRVYGILFPGSDRYDTSTGRARRKIRDAMHVATAIRDAQRFVTRDDEDILPKREALAEAFNGFQVFDPEAALAFVEQTRERYEASAEHPWSG